MLTVNIHEAKTRLSRLVSAAAEGEPFIIAKADKPLAKVTALDTPTGAQVKRRGFMVGQITIPVDFDRVAKDEIAALFEGEA